MGGVDLLRSRNRFPETLPSGLKVTLRLPRIRDCIIAGRVPLPILNHLVELAAQNGEAKVSMEDAEHMARFQDEIVRRAVVEIEGEPVALETEDVGDIAQEDYDRIVEICLREVNPTPAGAPT